MLSGPVPIVNPPASPAAAGNCTPLEPTTSNELHGRGEIRTHYPRLRSRHQTVTNALQTLASVGKYCIYSARQSLTSCSKKHRLAVRLLHLCYRRL